MATTTRKKKGTNVTAPTTVSTSLTPEEVGVDDLFSETSHYRVLGRTPDNKGFVMLHIESNSNVNLEASYVMNMLKTSDHYFNEEKVGREDKLWTQKQIDEAKAKGDIPADSTVRVGDIRVRGIRTIFESIYDAQVFTVVYETQPKEMTEKDFQSQREVQINKALETIDKAQKAKKGVANAARLAIQEIQDNPISKFGRGADRRLRGYKVQFTSRDGRYDCVDLDVTDTHNIRPVNINTIKELCVGGTLYIVE